LKNDKKNLKKKKEEEEAAQEIFEKTKMFSA
jgi:hypothetical protein